MQLEAELDCGPCRLRPLHPADAPSLARHANNPCVARHLRDRFPHPYAVDDALRFIAYAAVTDDECIAGIEVAGEIAAKYNGKEPNPTMKPRKP